MKRDQILKVVSVCGLIFFSTHLFAMTLVSPQIRNGQPLLNSQLFNHWGCKGKNLSPELAWDHVPAGTRSFAITMFDPDATTGSGWWHWVMVNIPKEVRFLVADAGNRNGLLMPKGAQMQRNDFGYHGYGGSCPPPNTVPHRYIFTVYALSVDELGIPADASPALANYFIHQYKIDEVKISTPTKMRQ